MDSDLKKIKCKIVDIKAIPNTNKQIVSVEFKLGKREWFKGFRLEYDRPISMEEFKREMLRVGIWPEAEEDFLAYVKQEADQPFTIETEVPEYIEKQTDNVEDKRDD